MSKEARHTLKELVALRLVVLLPMALLVAGWIANIVKLASMSFDPITVMQIVRVVGIFIPPVGAGMGFIPS